MKNNKKIFFKNRVKCFYAEPENYSNNRIKDAGGSLDFQDEGINEEDSENPEEQGDLS